MNIFKYDDRRTFVFGLIGNKISYSFSKKYFSKKFIKEKITYLRYEIFDISNINNIEYIFRKYKNIQGLNITIPYKREVFQYINYLSNEASPISSINTFIIKENCITGHNTDIFGFKKSFLKYLKFSYKKFLVLGNGGAALAVIYILKQLKVPYFIVSIRDFFSLKDIYIKKYKVIIHCTPIGTYSTMYQYPLIYYQYITKYYYFYDLIYNPQISKFLKKGAERGAIVKNGLEMLQIQAELSWYLWKK